MKAFAYDCPVEATLEIIGGKWKAICLYYLLDGPKRFSELLALLETVSTRILSKQLRELELAGVIERQVYAQVPPRVEYALTAEGETLIPLINLLCEWGEGRLLRSGKTAVYN